jgi:2-oxoisovalerate dehydrogenase E1 component
MTYGNGVPMCLRVRDRLAQQKIAARVLDLRWISPLPTEAMLHHALETGRVLAVDECRRSANLSEAIATCLFEHPSGRKVRFGRVTAADSFIPLADAAQLVLPDEKEILEAALELMKGRARP